MASWPSPIEHFWSHVTKGTECWLWTGAQHELGYGRITVGKKSVKAHRFAYEIDGSKIPKDFAVRHHCHEKLCVRRSHLYLAPRNC